MKTKVLFICHGNICRSPMAEYILKKLLKDHGINNVEVASAATSYEEIGNDIYPPAKAILRDKKIPFEKREARHITKEDYQKHDLIFGMDQYNMKSLMQYYNNDPENKIKKLLPTDVSDPWYSGNFEKAYEEISEGVNQIIKTYLM